MIIEDKIIQTINEAKKITVKIFVIKKTGFLVKNEQKILRGAGFFYKEDYIITNYHIVKNSDKIKIGTYDSDKLVNAKIIVFDEFNDICILKHELKFNIGIKLNKNELKEGQIVISMGMPCGLEYTSSIGIISSLSHNLLLENNTVIHDCIQIDSNLNLGNSGGPLLNINKEVIGMNTILFPQGNNLSFAIEINYLKKIVDNLLENTKV